MLRQPNKGCGVRRRSRVVDEGETARLLCELSRGKLFALSGSDLEVRRKRA